MRKTNALITGAKLFDELDEEKKQAIKKLVGNLPSSEYEAIPSKVLAKQMSISQRMLRTLISDAREFYPICSKLVEGGGYWIANNNEDISRFIRTIQYKIKTQKRTVKRMSRHI